MNLKKKWLIDILMVVLLLCIGTVLCINNEEPVEDTEEVVLPLTSEPAFLYKTPREGLIEALYFYYVEYPEIVYAQAILETGYFSSDLCIKNNNLFGLYNSKESKYYKFNHWSASVEAYKKWIQKRYMSPEDYYMFLDRIGYAEDPDYINKLKQIVKNESESSKRIYKEEGTGTERKELAS